MPKQRINKSLIFLLICFGAIKLAAQERRMLNGKIAVDSMQYAGGVHVVNLTAELGTTSNEQGDFSILARPGDSLFISSVQYQHERLVIQEASFQQTLLIELKEKFNELDEVRLDDIKLSGVLSGDINKVPESVYEKLGIPFPKPRRSSLELAVQSATGNGSPIAILNRLNGTTERLEKAESNNKLFQKVNKGLALFGPAFFMEKFKIEESEIINFLYFCAEDPEYTSHLQAESIFKLMELFENKIVSFKELRVLE
ncbi:hypothetical protein GCM10023115_43410 [Pontixanthobacter gangjinensis]|uniref:Carboxypeptidase-like regulatory domain-containing protein n=1 Tax=Christiangramia aestuarii TaxID=1028746 RepID=A0A7M3SY87_9FLAO|nr:hypothetical protein [Christiangramia aestuarii]MUP41568.1 carboxypeptidase-like regulatory domain-containing protein [Christiangramia aestuarii]